MLPQLFAPSDSLSQRNPPGTVPAFSSGRYSENCKWCAQSAHWKTGCETYGWVGTVASGAHCKTYNEDIVSVPLKMDDEIRVGFIRRSGIPLSAEGSAFVSVVRNKFAEPSAKPAK